MVRISIYRAQCPPPPRAPRLPPPRARAYRPPPTPRAYRPPAMCMFMRCLLDSRWLERPQQPLRLQQGNGPGDWSKRPQLPIRP